MSFSSSILEVFRSLFRGSVILAFFAAEKFQLVLYRSHNYSNSTGLSFSVSGIFTYLKSRLYDISPLFVRMFLKVNSFYHTYSLDISGNLN